MTKPLAVVGVWCASPGLMDTAPGTDQALVRLVCRRVREAHLPTYALVPWTKDLDHLARELKGWQQLVVRTHPDERIAMRDLVARHSADVGVVVNGACAVIDEAEINLAVARLAHGVLQTVGLKERVIYFSPRLKAFLAADWLSVIQDAREEWPEPTTTAADVRKFYGTHDPMNADARAVWAELRGK